MQNNRILKIKIKGKFITLQWEHYQQSTKNWDGHALTSADPPRPELIEYMKKMGKHIVGICEMQESDINKVEAHSISMSYGEDGSGIVISGIKELEHNASPLCINTPYKPEFGPEGMEECGMSAELQEDMDKLFDEAFRYINGDRAQQNLFTNQEEQEMEKGEKKNELLIKQGQREDGQDTE